MLTVTLKNAKLGLNDHGRPMSLDDFEFVKAEPGFHYELSRGYVAVSEVAHFFHACIITLIREHLIAYKLANPREIQYLLYGMECKLLIPEWESERHPDIAVYLTKPEGKKGRTMWRNWIPELVIEVVSASSADRDYVMKREEYWTLGVKEYWIVDVKRGFVVLLKRGKTDWIEKRLDANGTCTTKLLPKFKLTVQTIFDSVSEIPDEDE